MTHHLQLQVVFTFAVKPSEQKKLASSFRVTEKILVPVAVVTRAFYRSFTNVSTQ